MPSTVEQLSPTRVKITVEVPFADFKPSMDKAYAAIAKSVNIPGFRKGKVPPMVIDQRFGRGVVIQEAFNDAWSGFYGQAVQENNLSPLAQPDLEVTKLEDGDLIEFTAEVDVRPDFELPDFAGIEATVEPLEVPEALVDKQVEATAAAIRVAGDGRASRGRGRRRHHQPGRQPGWGGAAGRDRRRSGLHDRLRHDAGGAGRGRHRAVGRRVRHLLLDPGRRRPLGRGGRRRGDGEQGPGAGAAGGRRRARPAGVGVRHDRGAAGATSPSG